MNLVAADVSPLHPWEKRVRADSRRLLRIKETITLLSGDLDWIIMKCLEKDRTRRYETANGLSRFVERYLNDGDIDAADLHRLVADYTAHAGYEEVEFLPLAQTILGRDGNHMAALGLSLHMRHVPAPNPYI